MPRVALEPESGWNYQAYNAGSGATGIPQSLPGSKMASVGADWQTNADHADPLGSDLHRRRVRHAVQRLGTLAGDQLVLSRLFDNLDRRGLAWVA